MTIITTFSTHRNQILSFHNFILSLAIPSLFLHHLHNFIIHSFILALRFLVTFVPLHGFVGACFAQRGGARPESGPQSGPQSKHRPHIPAPSSYAYVNSSYTDSDDDYSRAVFHRDRGGGGKSAAKVAPQAVVAALAALGWLCSCLKRALLALWISCLVVVHSSFHCFFVYWWGQPLVLLAGSFLVETMHSVQCFSGWQLWGKSSPATS